MALLFLFELIAVKIVPVGKNYQNRSCSIFGPYFRAKKLTTQLGYNSGHIANPFSPLFYPHRSE